MESGEALTLVDIGVFFSVWRSRGGLGLKTFDGPLRPASVRHFSFFVFLSSSSSSPYPSSKTRTRIEAYPPPAPSCIASIVVAGVISAPMRHSAGEKGVTAFYPRLVTCCHSLKPLGTLPKFFGPTASFNVAGSCDVVRFWGGSTGFLLLLISVLWRHRTSSGVDGVPLLSGCFVPGTLKCPCRLASYEGRPSRWQYPPYFSLITSPTCPYWAKNVHFLYPYTEALQRLLHYLPADTPSFSSLYPWPAGRTSYRTLPQR